MFGEDRGDELPEHLRTEEGRRAAFKAAKERLAQKAGREPERPEVAEIEIDPDETLGRGRRAWHREAHRQLIRRRELNEQCRADLEAALVAAGMTPHPACANFLAVDVGDGRALARALEADGVIVRPLEPFGAPGSIRVTVGTLAENAVFAAALHRALQPR